MLDVPQVENLRYVCGSRLTLALECESSVSRPAVRPRERTQVANLCYEPCANREDTQVENLCYYEDTQVGNLCYERP